MSGVFHLAFFKVHPCCSMYQNFIPGNSLAVQWLGLSAFTAGAQVQSLMGELRSRKPHGVAKKKKISLLFIVE